MTATRLQGGTGRISISECTGEICTVEGASEGIGSDETGEAVIGKRSEAVQTIEPTGDDVGRTSGSEGNVNEEESLDLT